MLDGHFVMEHAGRNRSGRFFNFNGTAGIWRRAAIADAGGWQHDTLTEDMDLSYRAQLRGLAVRVPARDRRARRAARRDVGVQGAAVPLGQGLDPGRAASCCRRILRSNATFAQKIEAFFHLTNNFAYPLLLLLSLLLLPNLVFRTQHGMREVLLIDLPLFFGTTLSIASFYLASQREIERMTDHPARGRAHPGRC